MWKTGDPLFFFAQNLVGRKVVGYLPPTPDSYGCLLYEGGYKVVQGETSLYVAERPSPRELGAFSVSGVQSILLNPIYGYGRLLLPVGICEEWHKVFLYLCAVSEVVWYRDNFERIYEKFLLLLQENICETETAPTLLPKKLYLDVMLKHIRKFRSFMKGKEEVVISKDLHQTLNSRYVYLPYLWDLVRPRQKPAAFSQSRLEKAVNRARRAKGAYEKGWLWEEAVTYFVEQIRGWKITGRRIRTGYQEIDISVVNVSLDEELWQLGAYVLIECKNWAVPVGVPEIRNIAHSSTLKGNKTALLFTVNGITYEAKKEIYRLAMENVYILCLKAAELLTVRDREDCKKLLMYHWEKLRKETTADYLI